MIDEATMSKKEADDLLEEIRQCEQEVKAAEAECDEFKALYEHKIARAEHIRDMRTAEARNRIAELSEQLRRYAAVHVTDKKRSVPLPTGTLSFRKQPPKFFFDDLTECKGNDERLVKFVKHNAHSFLKVKVEESVDWVGFKGKLIISDDGEVFYSDTGELIDGLHAQFQPDKFTYKLLV